MLSFRDTTGHAEAQNVTYRTPYQGRRPEGRDLDSVGRRFQELRREDRAGRDEIIRPGLP